MGHSKNLHPEQGQSDIQGLVQASPGEIMMLMGFSTYMLGIILNTKKYHRAMKSSSLTISLDKKTSSF